jgi:hypothetical protein
MNTAIKKTAKGSIQNSEKDHWGALYIIAEHWQSDLKFYEDELNFLRKLIDKYFLWLIEEKHLENTRSVADKLSKLEKNRLATDEKLTKHMHHLTALIENPFPYDASVYKNEHKELKAAFSEFLKEFRRVKKAIFELAEHVIDSAKVKRLIESAG